MSKSVIFVEYFGSQACSLLIHKSLFSLTPHLTVSLGSFYDGVELRWLEVLNCIAVIKDVKIRLWQYLEQRLLNLVDSDSVAYTGLQPDG